MKILVEFFPNPDSIALHVDKKVIDSMIVSFNAPDCDKSKQPVYVQKLFNDFKDIGSVTLEPYEIHMQKGSVFEWHELIPKIEEILRTDFSDDGEIERLFSVSNIASDAATEAELKRLTD